MAAALIIITGEELVAALLLLKNLLERLEKANNMEVHRNEDS